MSFLVSFNGQFQPYRLPDNFHYDRVHQLYKAEKSKVVNESDGQSFKDVLQNEGHHKSKINSYNKNTSNRKDSHIAPHAHELMTRSVKTISVDKTVKDAAEIMDKYKIHHLPILNEADEMVGIISDRDLLIAKNDDKLKDIMQSEVIVCKEATQIQILAMIMLHEKIHSMPVVDHDNNIVGIVTQTDILRAIMTNKLINLWG
jgi:acetoin utilization protein AcuB